MELTNATLEQELTTLLNKCNQENNSDTPDFILAGYLLDCLAIWNKNVNRRNEWYGNTKTNAPINLDKN